MELNSVIKLKTAKGARYFVKITHINDRGIHGDYAVCSRKGWHFQNEGSYFLGGMFPFDNIAEIKTCPHFAHDITARAKAALS